MKKKKKKIMKKKIMKKKKKKLGGRGSWVGLVICHCSNAFCLDILERYGSTHKYYSS